MAATEGESAMAAAAEMEYPGSTKVAADVDSGAMAAEGVESMGNMRVEVSCLTECVLFFLWSGGRYRDIFQS